LYEKMKWNTVLKIKNDGLNNWTKSIFPKDFWNHFDAEDMPEVNQKYIAARKRYIAYKLYKLYFQI